MPNYTINAELNKLLARISDTLGSVVACYEEGQPWAPGDVAQAIAEHAREIDIQGVLEGRIKPEGVIVLCKFDRDRRDDGSTVLRLFEFSELASMKIRSIGNARTSYGELFGHVLQ